MKTTPPPGSPRAPRLPGFDNVIVGPWPMPPCDACGDCTPRLRTIVFNASGHTCRLCGQCSATDAQMLAAVNAVRARSRAARSRR
jgi:hypothetical protein